jgi:hypothetical protein
MASLIALTKINKRGMDLPVRTLVVVLTIACAATAANSSVRKRLTPQRVAELTAAAPAPAMEPKQYAVEITGITMPNAGPGHVNEKANTPTAGRVTFPADRPAIIEAIRELCYPVKFDPPKAAEDGNSLVAGLRPRAFETINTGWTIRLNASPAGKLIALSGKAEYVEAELMNGNFGAVAGPIYGDKGELISPNIAHQPKVKTTSTSFHVFAVPGEPYEITLYRGDKAGKHTIIVSVD